MSLFTRSLGAAVLAVSMGAVGCGDNPAGPETPASGSAKPQGAAQFKKPDPLVQKTFKAESCYYGALGLKLARVAYTESLGQAEPGPDKIPDFGTEPLEGPPTKEPPPAGSAAPAAGSGKPAASAKPAAPPSSAKPATSAKPPAPAGSAAAKPPAPKGSGAAQAAPSSKPNGSAGPGVPPARDPAAMARIRSVPYERFVRACHVAAGMKDPAVPELDGALREFADYALPLAKTIAEANAYYQKEQFKEDSFAKGKEYHTKLNEGFAKLDEQVSKVEAALNKFKSANPINTSEHAESQKLAEAVVKQSAETLVKLIQTPRTEEGLTSLKAEVEKLDGAIAPLRKYAEENKEARDPWATLVAGPADNFLNHIKAISEASPADVKVGRIVSAVTLFSRVHEGNNRALSRKLAEGATKGLQNNRPLRPKLPAPKQGAEQPQNPE